MADTRAAAMAHYMRRLQEHRKGGQTLSPEGVAHGRAVMLLERALRAETLDPEPKA